MTPLFIIVIVFVGVVTLVVGVGALLAGNTAKQAEDRLDMLTASGGAAVAKKAGSDTAALLKALRDEGGSLSERILAHFGDVRLFLSQADVQFSSTQFLAAIIGLGAAGVLGVALTRMPLLLAPVAGVCLGSLPILYVYIKRRRRIAAFARQLPDTLELIGRALRAGHSLAAGFNLVGDEMADPVASEFARCYDQQNLGVPLEEALEAMTQRVPNLDLRFFATAVILQRQTGGDLAEILDKIGKLIRERFQIWGQIQALTGEGRLSGVVLLALPPVLFVVMYRLNPEYVMILFTDELGKWMLTGAVALQLVGAFVIKKIINIKV